MEDAVTVREIALPADPRLDLSASAKDALAAIERSPFGLVPVVGAENKVVGVVTKGSLLTVFSKYWTDLRGESVS